MTSQPSTSTPESIILTNISGIKELKQIIQETNGIIIISFRANWCEPCKRVGPLIDSFLYNPPSFSTGLLQTYIIDIDECMQIYMELKKLRILTGVPSLLCYEKGAQDFYPIDSSFGSDKDQIISFFDRCRQRLLDLQQIGQ